MNLEINGQHVSLAQLRQVWSLGQDEKLYISLGDTARDRVVESQAEVDRVLTGTDTVYGVNTGFGQLAKVKIGGHELSLLQENLIRSHSVGVGKPLDDAVVRLLMVMKVIALARGYSGVRPRLINALCTLINLGMWPVIPSKGSVGASGDLAPLAHMAGVLVGVGDVRRNGKTMPAVKALEEAQLTPLVLAPKEGIALLNGTQVSTSLALAALFRAEHVLSASIAGGAMTADAIKGADTPFDARIHDVRGHDPQSAVAMILRKMMVGSDIRASHVDCHRVQDPYSVRCLPQVLGACLGVLQHAADVLEIEANAVTDNPLVFADSGAILSGGNFHAEPVALVADYMALSIAEIGSLAERRVALLIDSHLSELPAFLVKDSGLNSGFMMVQVTAAALVSENKTLAHPASVDSIPTSANQEDHVSMATFAARRLHDMLDNVSRIVAIELLAASQGLEFRLPQRSSAALQDVLNQVRSVSAAYISDRSLSADIEALALVVDNGDFTRYGEDILPSFQT
jgi:histidine ammonia-lyase